MFNAFAEAEHKAVPVVRKARVRGDNDGVSTPMVGDRKSGTGYSAYEDIAVNTTSIESRGFESDRYKENCRRNELVASLEAEVVKAEDASSTGSSLAAAASAAVAAATFRRAACRRRCGRSSFGCGIGDDVNVSSDAP